MLPASEGGPVILYDAEDGKLGEFADTYNVSAPLDQPILGVARPVETPTRMHTVTSTGTGTRTRTRTLHVLRRYVRSPPSSFCGAVRWRC